MNINELCIGNYVIGGNDEIHTIDAISDEYVSTISMTSNSCSKFNHPIMPNQIILNEDWLEDLGFEKTIHQTLDINSDFYWSGGIYIYVFKDDNKMFLGSLLNDECYPLVNVVEIKFVSQLQNLYQLLTGNELTKRSDIKIKWENFLIEIRHAELGDKVLFEMDDRIPETLVNNELTKKCSELSCSVFTERINNTLIAVFGSK